MFTVKQVAETFKVTQRTVYRWISDGKLAAIKVCGSVRVLDEEVERLKRGE